VVVMLFNDNNFTGGRLDAVLLRSTQDVETAKTRRPVNYIRILTSDLTSRYSTLFKLAYYIWRQ